jgi:hypothetical protein
MGKGISEELVIGNALFSSNKNYLTKEQICHYWHIVDSLLPEGYYTKENRNSFTDFCENYSFLVKVVGDAMIINCERSLLERYFRVGTPTKIIKIFDDAGAKLNETEANQIEQLNYDNEKPKVPRNVKKTEENRKILVKTLLK